jgi:tripartite-type tricarboxylate transporter receptor subunit TctC
MPRVEERFVAHRSPSRRRPADGLCGCGAGVPESADQDRRAVLARRRCRRPDPRGRTGARQAPQATGDHRQKARRRRHHRQRVRGQCPAADGYTLLLASQTNAIGASLYRKLSFNPIGDFVGISLLGREPGVLVVHPSLPVNSVAELIAYAKERPGQLNYASSGNGCGQHLFMALFASMADVKLTHVPYRGSGQAATDLLGGTVLMAMPGAAGMVGHIRAGKLRPLATTGVSRSPQLPDVPTLAESGLAGHAAYVWMGLLAPKGTPAAIIERLHRELIASLAAPEVKGIFNDTGVEIVGSTPAQFAAYLREERERWARTVKDTGAKID